MSYDETELLSILHVKTAYVMSWQVSKYISSLLKELKRSIICCQGFLVQIQGKMTLSLIKTIGYCFLSGLSMSKHSGKPPHKISLFNLRKCICYNRQNRDQIKNELITQKRCTTQHLQQVLLLFFYLVKENASIMRHSHPMHTDKGQVVMVGQKQFFFKLSFLNFGLVNR